jgi:FkbM family methyltransferase
MDTWLRVLGSPFRYVRNAILAPRTITQTLERIHLLESALASALESLPGFALAARGGAELQRFPGYNEADLTVFGKFQVDGLRPEPGFITEFIGSRIRSTSVHAGARHLDGTVLGIPVPGDNVRSEAAEWVGLLKSVLSAKDRFCAMELGAGYGPWLVAGAVAAKQRGITNVRLCGVEADPGRFALMKQHFRDNGLNPDEHILVQGAVGVEAGKSRWPKIAEPANDCGARPNSGVGTPNDVDYRGRTFGEYIEVDVIPFTDLLGREPAWDLVHIDVQGWEGAICTRAIDALNDRVRWLIIGTHSRKLDGDLFDLFWRNDWVLENEKPTRFTYTASAASPETMPSTADGIQVWRNPRLA